MINFCKEVTEVSVNKYIINTHVLKIIWHQITKKIRQSLRDLVPWVCRRCRDKSSDRPLPVHHLASEPETHQT